MNATLIQEAFMLFKPVVQCAFKLVPAAAFQGKHELAQVLRRCRFRLSIDAAVHRFDVIVVSQLHGNIGKHLHQTFFTITGNALYIYAFFPYVADGLKI
mgnify:CR=1 FL=1